MLAGLDELLYHDQSILTLDLIFLERSDPVEYIVRYRSYHGQ